MKNTKFLLPSKFKNAGWWILGITLVLTVIYFAFESQCHFSFNDIRNLLGMDSLQSKFEFSSFLPGPDSDLLFSLIGILLIVGGIFIGFSRNKEDDEFIEQLRYKSLILSLYINSALLVLCLIFIWGFDFLTVMQFNIFSVLYVFIICFYIRLYINKRSLRHEKQD
ncbi:MAG: hypothetical protein J5644_01440 [Bacteroidales bacterium]|nr:hypothetical protein [Bacteroidales bacterium]